VSLIIFRNISTILYQTVSVPFCPLFRPSNLAVIAFSMFVMKLTFEVVVSMIGMT